MGARSEDKLRSIAEDLAARGTQAVYEPTDVTREEDCRRLVEKAVSSFGRIDVLICNAGISMRALFDEVDLGVLKRLMDVDFYGERSTAPNTRCRIFRPRADRSSACRR